MLNISKKTILLADNDVSYMKKVKEKLEDDKFVEVIDMANSGEEVFEKTLQKRPDILLMDILLDEKDGLWVLKELNEKKIDCTCVVLSALVTVDIVKQAMDLGAVYYMKKPIESDLLLERISQVERISQAITSDKAVFDSVFLSKREQIEDIFCFKQQQIYDLECEVSKLLNKMGMSPSIKGYHFIKKGVCIILMSQNYIFSITKNLYPDIARYYCTTAAKVERAIRHAIEITWKKEGKKFFCEMAGYHCEEKPTNSQFLSTLVEYMR